MSWHGHNLAPGLGVRWCRHEVERDFHSRIATLLPPHEADHMGNRTPRKAQGKPARAEGEHGPKTHKRLIEQLESGPSEVSRDAQLEEDRVRGAASGRRRLVEDREQHDEAEKNSEREHLFQETR